MAGGEVGESVGAAHGLHVVHVAFASEVARGGQIDLERLAAVVTKNIKNTILSNYLNAGRRQTMQVHNVAVSHFKILPCNCTVCHDYCICSADLNNKMAIKMMMGTAS